MTRSPDSAPSPAGSTARTALATLVLVAAPVLVLLLRLGYGDSLPDPLPRHWNARGEVDGTTSLMTLTLVAGLVTAGAALVGLAALAARAHLTVAVEVVLGAGWVAWLMAGVYLTVVANAVGAETADEVDLSLGWTALVVVLPLALAWLLWRTLRGTGVQSQPPATPASSLSIGPDERVVWVGQAGSRTLLLVAAGLVVAGTALTVLGQEGVVLIGVGLLLALLHRVTVRVDREAVTVRWGQVPFLRHRIPLAKVAAARAEHVEPARWGGWGYRFSSRGRAAVVRRGPGLVLSLRTGSEFAVTVDRPEDAADLVNALVASRQADATERH